MLFKPTDPDWSLINPELRKLVLKDEAWSQNINFAKAISMTADGTYHHLSTIHKHLSSGRAVLLNPGYTSTNINHCFYGTTTPGAFARTIEVSPGEELNVAITAATSTMLFINFNFFLHEGSSLKVRYIGNSNNRQLHSRITVRHSANSYSDIKTAVVAGKLASSTSMVEVIMPEGCAGSKSQVKSMNWSYGGRVGSLPIIRATEANVEAKHGNTVFDIDKESIFMLQLRGIEEKSARKEVLKGQLISGLDEYLDFDIIEQIDECLAY